MSKYIRTDDGRILEFDKLNEVSKLSIDMTEEPIRVADTPEELCDCFVVVGNKHTVWDKQHCLGLTFEQVKQSYSAYDFEIYGAIWTDKGLLYVAKMNEEGSLITYEY